MTKNRIFIVSLLLILFLVHSRSALEPVKQHVINGEILSEEDVGIPGILVRLYRNGIPIAKAEDTSKEKGKYTISFPEGAPIDVLFYNSDWEEARIKGISGKRSHSINKVMYKLAKARMISIIDFPEKNSKLSTVQEELLINVWKSLKTDQFTTISVEGYGDPNLSEEDSLALAERRANVVKEFLVKQGLSEEKISTISYGESRPSNPPVNDRWNIVTLTLQKPKR